MTALKTTPMIQQYLATKEQYADALLFFRMGDFYEMFFEDAEIASGVLEITLTSRNKKDKKPIPMCGVPVRAVQGYIARLIEKGFKVAICDQVEDPATAKGLVKREVIRVITPGMIVEHELLDEKSHNYLLACCRDSRGVGIAYLDISTGTFRVLESEDPDRIVDEALRISPREVLLPADFRNDARFARMRQTFSERAVTFLDNRFFAYKAGYDRLIEQFGTLSLEGFGCELMHAGIAAAGAVLFYVGETQKQKIEHIVGIEPYTLDHYLIVDEVSSRNLELLNNIRTGSLKGTLIGIMDQTMTAMGARLLKQWMRYPLIDADMIRLRLDAVAEAREKTEIRIDVRDLLKSVYDLERLSSKINMGHANARDLLALKHSLFQLPAINALLENFETDLYRLDRNVESLYGLGQLIDSAIREDAPPTVNEGGIINSGFNHELDDLIRISRDGKGWLAQLEAREKEVTRINTLKVRYNKVFGYYIEVPKSQSSAVPPHYVRKQTLVNAERYITDELKTFEAKVLGAEEQRAALEYRLFNEIRMEVIRNHMDLQSVAKFVALIDCLLNLAEIAARNQYFRPEINKNGSIRIEAGRHPVVEKMITGERFVPNSVHLDNNEEQILIITGPNMAGKSTILRQVALLVIMTQMGSFVPAEKASIGIVDRIFTRVGALDNLSQGQSTFMVEMEETANILNNTTHNSLIILDEIGRGTSTFDGLSIAWAVAEYLHDYRQVGVKTLFATHYHELTDLSLTKKRVRNYNVAVREWNDQIIFLRKLVDGGTNRSYGIQVARLAGIPVAVIERAKKILSNIEKEEHYINGAPVIADADDSSIHEGHIQLNLFSRKDHAIIRKLQQLNTSVMTPLDALNFLDELKQMTENDPEKRKL